MPRILVVLIAALAVLAPGRALAGEFRETLDAHIAAVTGRDLAALEPTLTAGDRLVLIFPNGNRTDTREAFVEFHRGWFATPGWRMRFDVDSVIETDSMAAALVRTRYEEVTETGDVSAWSESWLALTFRREPHGWALVHDQNTRIRASE